MLSMLLPRLANCHCASFLQLFQKFVQTTKFPTFIRKFSNKSFLLYNLLKRTNVPSKIDFHR